MPIVAKIDIDSEESVLSVDDAKRKKKGGRRDGKKDGKRGRSRSRGRRRRSRGRHRRDRRSRKRSRSASSTSSSAPPQPPGGIGSLVAHGLTEGFFGCQTGGGPANNICVKFLASGCTDPRCVQKHPVDPVQVSRWITYFGQQPCKHGEQCNIRNCVYLHSGRSVTGGGTIF
eukprot:TRINITY_DN57047_c0_g1_i1.p1 TRINITY_DN57047_c0_g1~~TRINITY_DN57047_c0_g1_i1.p1  ORF type:complete len:172 (+),score=21.23 TRINITY_DN57047_c0_g1_i1:193-708(+)